MYMQNGGGLHKTHLISYLHVNKNKINSFNTFKMFII